MQISARVICDSLTAVIENPCHADRRCSHLGDGSHASRRDGSLDAPDQSCNTPEYYSKISLLL